MPLGTGESLFYNMAGAKRNGAATFIELIMGGSTHFLKQISTGRKLKLKMKFEMQNVSFWGQSSESCKKRNAWKDMS